MKRILIYGASGHAKVLFSILKSKGFKEFFFIDRDINKRTFNSHPIFNSFDEFFKENKEIYNYETEKLYFTIAIGGDRGKERLEINHILTQKKFSPLSLIHPSAWVADTARIGQGVQVLGMAAISEDVFIGNQTIVNTNATVDHETVIGQGCHIMPGATLAGCVEVGDFSTIGSNATILPRIKIGEGVTIGAGAVVTRDIPKNTTVVGVPAKEVERKSNG